MAVAAQNSAPMAASYAVPKRFGMAGMLAITTFMALLFGLLRACGAHPAVYIFLGVLSLVTCLVQMRYGDVPRIASIAAGTVILPLSALAFVLLTGDSRQIMATACVTPFLAMAGALSGYLAGACTAGLFLMMDLAEPYLPGGGGPKYARTQPARDNIMLATLLSSPLVTGNVLPPPTDNPFVPRTTAFDEPPQRQPPDESPDSSS